ncbi:MAG: GH92 family glycosyl hydrolase, partial [Gammaproteobacteria bacterium]
MNIESDMQRWCRTSRRWLIVVGICGFAAMNATADANLKTSGDPASLVNPFIGTSGTKIGGPIDTFPGASLPFGMIQWSPDTPSQPAGGGYDYKDHQITGFSLTHLSGPGCSVFGDIGVLPTIGRVQTPATASQPFAHADEQAAPGWYAV